MTPSMSGFLCDSSKVQPGVCPKKQPRLELSDAQAVGYQFRVDRTETSASGRGIWGCLRMDRLERSSNAGDEQDDANAAGVLHRLTGWWSGASRAFPSVSSAQDGWKSPSRWKCTVPSMRYLHNTCCPCVLTRTRRKSSRNNSKMVTGLRLAASGSPGIGSEADNSPTT